MTPESINRKIAELCGWTCDEDRFWYETKDGALRRGPPNYLGSLDACREFENQIKDWGKYFGTLARIIAEVPMEPDHKAFAATSILWLATPAQRCEAFLRLKGEWVE